MRCGSPNTWLGRDDGPWGALGKPSSQQPDPATSFIYLCALPWIPVPWAAAPRRVQLPDYCCIRITIPSDCALAFLLLSTFPNSRSPLSLLSLVTYNHEQLANLLTLVEGPSSERRSRSCRQFQSPHRDRASIFIPTSFSPVSLDGESC